MTNGSCRSGPEEWTTEAFLDHFLRVHRQMPERRFVFALGAGASVTSGIPTGGQLVDRWLAELKLRDSNSKDQSDEHWANNGLGIDDFEFKRRAEFYPQIYERRFGDDLVRISTLVSVLLTIGWPRTPLFMRVGKHSRR